MAPARAAFFALALASSAQANPHEFTLANGLRLIVKEDHRAPTVVHQVWYRARSEEHTSELQSRLHLVCRLLREKKKHATGGCPWRRRCPSTRRPLR